MILLLMKKSWICLLVMIISVLILINLISAVRINEIETNPPGSDSGNEWIELYSENQIDLSGWKIINNDNDTFQLNQSFQGYIIINFQGQFLDNSDERVFLYNQNSLIDSSTLLSDSTNDNKTWQYCSGEWKFADLTKGFENNCNIQNPSQNNTQNPSQNNDSNQKTLISLNIDWEEDEIINGDEFDIEVDAKNLKDKKYNFKIWINNDDEDIISDRYGEDSSEKKVWKSGSYYIYNLFEGPGDKTETAKLRIRKGYSNFSGDAEICFKFEGESESEDCESIEVLKKEAEINRNNTKEIKTATKSSELTNSITGNVIRLGSSESKETIANNQKNTNNNVIYESKNEKIKKYSIISFAVLCLGLVILVLFKKIS